MNMLTKISLHTRTTPGGESAHENVKIKYAKRILTHENLESM